MPNKQHLFLLILPDTASANGLRSVFTDLPARLQLAHLGWSLPPVWSIFGYHWSIAEKRGKRNTPNSAQMISDQEAGWNKSLKLLIDKALIEAPFHLHEVSDLRFQKCFVLLAVIFLKPLPLIEGWHLRNTKWRLWVTLSQISLNLCTNLPLIQLKGHIVKPLVCSTILS